MKRIGDDRPVDDGERGQELAADLGEQNRLLRRRSAVELGHAPERVLVSGAGEPKRHAPYVRPGGPGPVLGQRAIASSPRAAELVDPCVRERVMEVGGHDLRVPSSIARTHWHSSDV